MSEGLSGNLAQLRVDARKQLLEVLTPEQRAKLESMMGSGFKFSNPNASKSCGCGTSFGV